jgi:uncharacterized protein
MRRSSSAGRFCGLPTVAFGGVRVPVATGLRARLLGLSYLDREQAGPGLLIPRCANVHTFGMRFEIDVAFLDGRGRVIDVRVAVPPRRLAGRRGAAAVLEWPTSARSGKFVRPRGE